MHRGLPHGVLYYLLTFHLCSIDLIAGIMIMGSPQTRHQATALPATPLPATPQASKSPLQAEIDQNH